MASGGQGARARNGDRRDRGPDHGRHPEGGRPTPPERELAARLEVSRAGYHRHWRASAPAAEATGLRDRLQHLALAHRHYGYRRLGPLLRREGFLGDLLTLAEACESSDDALFDRAAGLLHLTSQQINFAHLQALAWADHISD